MLPKLYVPEALVPKVWFHVPESLCSRSYMFLKLSSTFPKLYVPEALCSRSSMLPELYAPEALCSQSSLLPELCVAVVENHRKKPHFDK